jgi:uncharacterized small protein (DUF1192 family)
MQLQANDVIAELYQMVGELALENRLLRKEIARLNEEIAKKKEPEVKGG